jgi:hypothetical protein
MTDGIDPTRLRRDTGYVQTTEPPPSHKTVSHSLPNLADLPDASFGPLPRVRAEASTPRFADPPKTPVQIRLDAFLQDATPSYTVDGTSVPVPIPFRMTVDVRKLEKNNQWRTHEAVVTNNSMELRAAAASVGLVGDRHLSLLRSGRATPEDVRKVTQALIDRGRLPPADKNTMPDPISRVRQMMFDYGLGLDCASYTQQAFLASRELQREQTHLKADIMNEDLTNLSREGFQQVPIDDAQPGDILVLDPPPKSDQPGHTLMVYDRRDATADEIKELRRLPGFDKGQITAYTLDSSYGSDATAQKGGVMRQLWWRNDDSKSWARGNLTKLEECEVSPADTKHADPQDRPYLGHVIRGYYRPLGETP